LSSIPYSEVQQQKQSTALESSLFNTIFTLENLSFQFHMKTLSSGIHQSLLVRFIKHVIDCGTLLVLLMNHLKTCKLIMISTKMSVFILLHYLSCILTLPTIWIKDDIPNFMNPSKHTNLMTMCSIISLAAWHFQKSGSKMTSLISWNPSNHTNDHVMFLCLALLHLS
jgi:hypothetical protein